MGQGKMYKCEFQEKQFELPSIEDAIGNLGDFVSVSSLRLVYYLETSCRSLYNLFTKYKSVRS